MPKPIKLTQEWVKQMVDEFTKALGGLKLSDGKVSYTKSLTYGKEDGGATILFDPVAYAKMLMLLHSFADEVAWHGTVERLDKKTFVIKDLYVYPQEITGGTVSTDQERYQSWLMNLDDEVFNALHMQGHSHVNFSTNPSSVDTKFYDSILEQLGDDDFYIFMIFNKRLERTIKIYDIANNILYEDSDIDVGILCDGGDLEQFIADAKTMAVKKVSNYPAAGSTGVRAGTAPAANAGTGYTGSGQTKLYQSPGYYQGSDNITPLAGYYDADTDFDEEIFGARDGKASKKSKSISKRNAWWNEK